MQVLLFLIDERDNENGNENLIIHQRQSFYSHRMTLSQHLQRDLHRELWSLQTGHVDMAGLTDIPQHYDGAAALKISSLHLRNDHPIQSWQ